ncbi:unnamed protein product [Sympodiomycopsis kandeliae]
MPPGPHDRTDCAFLPPGETLRKVPVLRIFGATPRGQRVCMHLHGVFPYCYIPYQDTLDPQYVLYYISRLGAELNAAITASLRGNPALPESHQHIAAIHLVKGVPFYGYHVGWKYFLKISFVDPTHNFRLATILQSGRVMKTEFQPYEIHIRYQLQFMLDYNVFGCDYIDLQEAHFRLPVPEHDEDDDDDDEHVDVDSSEKYWDEFTIPSDRIQPSGTHRTSFCELEIDAVAKNVLNRSKLRTRSIHHDFDEDEQINRSSSSSQSDQKLVPSLSGLWEEEAKRRTKAGLSPTPPPPDPSKDQRQLSEGETPQWMAWERLNALLDARISLETQDTAAKKRQPKDFTQTHPLDPHIATTFDSVEIFHHRSHELTSDPMSSTQATQMIPSTLYDLEYHSSQPNRDGVKSDGSSPSYQNGSGPTSSLDLDLEFFGTQAFQSHVDEIERQGAIVDGDDEHDEDVPQPSVEQQQQQPSQQQQQQQHQPSAGPSTPTTPLSKPLSAPLSTPQNKIGTITPRTLLKTPTKKSALRTPNLATASTQQRQHPHSVRFQSPTLHPHPNSSPSEHLAKRRRWYREDSDEGEMPQQSKGTDHSGDPSSSNESPSTPSPLKRSQSQFDDKASTQEYLSTPESIKASQDSQSNSEMDHLPASQLGTQGWLSAHIQAQTRWRGEAHTQAMAATQKQSSANTTLPAMTQLASSSSSTSHSSRSISSASQSDTNTWTYAVPAPTSLEVTASMNLFGIPPVEYQDPYYSNPVDVPAHAREYAGRSWKFASKTIKYLPEFPCSEFADFTANPRTQRRADQHSAKANLTSSTPHVTKWEYGIPPTPRSTVEAWLHREKRRKKKVSLLKRRRAEQATTQASQLNSSHNSKRSETTAATQPSFGFKLSQRKPTAPPEGNARDKQHMTILAIEVHVNTRGEMLPNPKRDAVQAIIYSFQNEDESLGDTGSRPGLRTGLIMLDTDQDNPIRPDRLGLAHLPIDRVDSELDMFNTLVDVVRELDPEILVGFEIHNGSWGYVIDRARHELSFDLVPELARVNNLSTGTAGGKGDSWGWTQTSALKITGRHILNIWRLMRGELNLNVYSYENIVFHLLRSRVPKLPFSRLSQWYRSGQPNQKIRVLKYWIERCETDLMIIETSELVFRTAEFARIYGIDFFSVISRGSQFKVESVMFRIAKPECFLLPSPNTKQVAEQNAAECLPLIMEPQSAFYKGPLLVLDFQSLYPSVMIAYNICYSTCLGRVAKFQGQDKFGITELQLPPGLLTLLKDDVNISPNGLIYVKPHLRRSLLAKMLGEILDTRVMIKGSMKGMKSDKAFMRIQNARQLSLKLLANVTYGYTSATFSGRMPCVEIADSIVQSGRETLEKAIQLIHATERWGAQVVYGDTDSLFIYLPDRSKDDAFRIGNEIADAVTAQNPKPIKLKFEKVYLPSVLLAKKRYVGFKYESPEETVPEFNAKGIETVRRDGFPALQKMLEACIRVLFTTQDLSLVKAYCQQQWRAILAGTVAIHNFIIAKEVRLGGYSENGVPPPGAAVSTRRMLLDARSEPQHAERVPYIITQGEPKAKLNDLAVSPETMLANPQLQLNALYYITRGIIPPLTRVFNLLGADVEAWFREMPRPSNTASHQYDPSDTTLSRLTLTDHYKKESCLNCHRPTKAELCLDCHQTPASVLYSIIGQHSTAIKKVETVEKVCRDCSRLTPGESSSCVSIDCPILYERETAKRKEKGQRSRLKRVEILLEEGPRTG